MSLLKSSYMDVPHPCTPGSGNLRDMLWPDTDGAQFLGGWNISSLLASVIHDLPELHEPGLTSDCQASSSAHFCPMEDLDLPQICMRDDPGTGITVSQTVPELEGSDPEFHRGWISGLATPRSEEYAGVPQSACQSNPHGDGPSNMAAALLEFQAPWSWGLPTSTRQQPPASGVAAQQVTAMGLPLNDSSSLREEGDATCRWPASTPSQSPMASHGTVSSGWMGPVLDPTQFVDLSDFLTPWPTSSRHLTQDQPAGLGNNLEVQMSTAQGHAILETTDSLGAPTALGMSSIQDLEKARMDERGQVRQFPVRFVSVRRDEFTLDPVQTRVAGPSFVASSSSLLPSNQWKSGSPSFIFPELHPLNSAGNPAPFALEDHGKPRGIPPLAPVTPEKPRRSFKRNRSHKQEEDERGGSRLPADSSNCCGPRKLQKRAPPGEPNLAFRQVGIKQSHLLEVRAGMVLAAPKDVLKAEHHVARERRRRDLMNSRYQTLESLLPKLPCRRDRFAIVDDTKLYVKEMQQKLADLKTTTKHCQAAKAAEGGTKQQDKEKAALPEAGAGKSCPLSGAAGPDTDSSMSEDLNVEVVIDPRDEGQEVLVSVQCRSSSGAKLFGSLLRAMEKLQLDVSQLSTSKSAHFFFCNAVCKPQKRVVRSDLSREKMIREMVTTLRPLSKMEEG